ncbi:MAG: rhomboid family intramembrane serine protease [bacterium]|nr:rhomboid family intramembrane serine protease [bacterium]
MSKWERKFGKYAIPNLTVVLLLGYVVGYILEWTVPRFMNYLTLNPYAILHGQIWRVLTWVLAPPSSATNLSDLFFVLIMLMFYFSLGTSLERVWGTWKYNVYIFTGILLTVAGSFLCAGVLLVLYGGNFALVGAICEVGALEYSTFYINMSIFLAYAATFPNAEVLLMFVIPVKVKILGIIYGAVLALQMISYFFTGSWFSMMAVAASLINFLIFVLRSKNRMHLNPKQVKRRAEFKHDIKRNMKVTTHKCAICGRTEEDDPTLEFRFCSKCKGNYEYCQYHLFTHEHRS